MSSGVRVTGVDGSKIEPPAMIQATMAPPEFKAGAPDQVYRVTLDPSLKAALAEILDRVEAIPKGPDLLPKDVTLVFEATVAVGDGWVVPFDNALTMKLVREAVPAEALAAETGPLRSVARRLAGPPRASGR